MNRTISENLSNTKGEIQKYTVLAAKDEQSEYGYIVEKIKLKK